MIQSRAAIAAAVVSTLAVLLITLFKFIKSKNTQVKILISLISLFIIVLAILFTLYKIDFFGSRWKYAFESSEWLGRVVPWAAAWESIKAAPWFGFGLGSSYNLYFTFVPADARLFVSTYNYNHAHSEYLEYIQESGLLGAIGFLIFLGYFFSIIYINKILKKYIHLKTCNWIFRGFNRVFDTMCLLYCSEDDGD
jgi:O-antigen ligase